MGRNRILLGTKPVLVRMSEHLARELARLAESEDVSRNTLISMILAEHVAAKQAHTASEDPDSQKV